MSRKKIAVVTSSRADFSHLSGVISKIKSSANLELQLVVTGTHLSASHGYTIDEIIARGFEVHTKIDMHVDGDTPSDICASISTLTEGMANYFTSQRPDCVIVLGDRYELLAVANAATICQIPIVHIHGGEITEGVIDDVVRHSVTKMAKLHFVATEEYRHRVVQMGEYPETVFNFGAPGLDNLKTLRLKSKSELENELGLSFKKRNILLTYHPISLSETVTREEIGVILQALSKLNPTDTSIIITMPNSDTYNSIVVDELKTFLTKFSGSKIYSNLGLVNYLSLVTLVDVVVGNSSSGIIEAPFLRKAVINYGIRQKGRKTSSHVIHANGADSLDKALERVFDSSFQKEIAQIPSIYGDGAACDKIVKTLAETDFFKLRFKKFYDINF